MQMLGDKMGFDGGEEATVGWLRHAEIKQCAPPHQNQPPHHRQRSL